MLSGLIDFATGVFRLLQSPAQTEQAQAEALVREWEIWHTYNSFAFSDLARMSLVARAMVESGLATVALSTDGEVWWRDMLEVRTGRVSIAEEDQGSSKVEVPAELPPFVMECVGQAAAMAVHENRLLGPQGRTPYVRAYLGLIGMTSRNVRVNLYPQLKLYNDGVLLVEFRTLSPDCPISVDELVTDHVNLFDKKATKVDVPPLFLKAYVNAVLRDHSALYRLTQRTLLTQVNALVKKFSREINSGDFVFESMELDAEFFDAVKIPGDAPIGLRRLASMVELSVEYVVHRNRHVVGARKALRRSPAGGTWVGRPAVYVIDYPGRNRSAATMRVLMRHVLAKVLNRTTAPPADAKASIGRNLRSLDDYAVFMNRGVMLWLVADLERLVQGAGGTRPGARSFVLEKQVQAEFIEHLDAAYRRLEELSGAPQSSLRRLLSFEHELDRLEQQVTRASHFGELVVFFRGARSALGHRNTRRRIRENVRLRALQLTEEEHRRTTRVGWVLTSLFGLGAIPSLASDAVKPIVEAFGLWRPQDSARAELYFLLVSALAVFLMGTLAAGFVRGRRPVV